jgi:hypothetical protein
MKADLIAWFRFFIAGMLIMLITINLYAQLYGPE